MVEEIDKTQDSKQENELPLLTYNSLYNILREEKKNKTLQLLPNFFFPAVEQYFIKKEEEIKEAQKNKNTDKFRKEINSKENSKKIYSELISKRCQKISIIAIENYFSKDNLHNEDSICKEEEIYFLTLKEGLKKLEKNINKND